jgi:dihydrofolate reductase
MRKIILSLAISFDGYIEGPNREIDWLSFSEETGLVLNKFLQEIDTVLYGRVSYEAWGTYSPAEDAADFEKSFYSKLHAMRKYVFSTTESQFPGNPVVVQSDIREAMQDLKRQPGKNIWLYGGSGLITSFMNLDLVDEFYIAVYPIVLGAGKPLFKDIDHRVPLKLREVKPAKSGAVLFTYERA